MGGCLQAAWYAASPRGQPATARGTHGSAAESVTTARASSDRHESSGSSGCRIERPVVRVRAASRAEETAVQCDSHVRLLLSARVDYRRRRNRSRRFRYKKDQAVGAAPPCPSRRRAAGCGASGPCARCLQHQWQLRRRLRAVPCHARIRNTCRCPRTAASVDKLAPGGGGGGALAWTASPMAASLRATAATECDSR